jgi:hypothetical protein
MTISLWILRMRNVLDKRRRRNQNIHFVFGSFFRKSCRLWDIVEKCCGAREATDEPAIRHMPFVYWISKGTRALAHAHGNAPRKTYARKQARVHAHASTRVRAQKCVILTAFPRQQWFSELATSVQVNGHIRFYKTKGLWNSRALLLLKEDCVAWIVSLDLIMSLVTFHVGPRLLYKLLCISILTVVPDCCTSWSARTANVKALPIFNIEWREICNLKNRPAFFWKPF